MEGSNPSRYPLYNNTYNEIGINTASYFERVLKVQYNLTNRIAPNGLKPFSIV